MFLINVTQCGILFKILVPYNNYTDVLIKHFKDSILLGFRKKTTIILKNDLHTLMCFIVNHCTAARSQTCSDCIQIGSGCSYCSDQVRLN